MKRKTIVATTVCIVAVFVNMYFSTIVHEILNETFYGVNTLTIARCISSLKTHQNHFAVFISLQLFVMLGVA